MSFPRSNSDERFIKHANQILIYLQENAYGKFVSQMKQVEDNIDIFFNEDSTTADIEYVLNKKNFHDTSERTYLTRIIRHLRKFTMIVSGKKGNMIPKPEQKLQYHKRNKAIVLKQWFFISLESKFMELEGQTKFDFSDEDYELLRSELKPKELQEILEVCDHKVALKLIAE